MNIYIKQYTTIEELYLDNHKLVYAFLNDYIDDPLLKDDLASIIWVRIFEKNSLFLKMGPKWTKNYIRVMVRNAAFDYFEELKREREFLSERISEYEISMSYDTIEEEFFSSSVDQYLEDACNELKQEEKELIQMKFFYQMSTKDIAGIMEIPEGTIRVRQLRILRKLRREILRLKKEDEE